MPTLTSSGGAWRVPVSPSSEPQVRILTTENTFLDQNIVVEVAAATAATGPILNITDSTTAVTVGTAADGKYPLTNSLSGQTTYTTGGWIGTGGLSAATDNNVRVGYINQSTMNVDSIAIASGETITPSASATQTLSISEGYEAARTIKVLPMSSGTQAAASVTGTAVATLPTVANAAQSFTGKTQVTISPTTANTDITNAESRYYVSINAVAPASTINLTKNVSQTGYLGQASQIIGNSVNTTSSNRVYYATLDEAAVSVVANGQATKPTAASTSATVNNKTKLNLTPTSATSGIDTYYVNFQVNAPGTTISNFTKTVPTNGYIANADQITVSGNISANTATYYIPITSGSLTAGAGSVTATSSNVNASVATTPPSSGYYITATGSGSASVDTAGWIAAGTSQASNNANAYISLNSATYTQSQANGTVTITEGYTAGFSVEVARGTISSGANGISGYENDSTVVPAGGYLFINAGYHPNTQISLDTILGGNADVAATTDAHILQGYAAYDVDGKLLSGTIPTYAGNYTTS